VARRFSNDSTLKTTHEEVPENGHLFVFQDVVLTYTSFGDINESVSCEAVLESPYATVRGIPVAAGGVIWSVLVLLIAARGMRRDNPDASIAAGYIFVLATVGDYS
jgi:uncharacterized membrane protein